LKIAGGIDEKALARQSLEIDAANRSMAKRDGRLVVLHSIEMNLNPRGEGDMEAKALRRLDLVLGSFHSSLRTREDQTERYLRALQNPHVQFLGIRADASTITASALAQTGPRVFSTAAKLNKAVEIDCYPTGRISICPCCEPPRGRGSHIVRHRRPSSMATALYRTWFSRRPEGKDTR